MDETKRTYRVKSGKTFGVGNSPAGTLVELTEAEAAGLLDFVEPVRGHSSETPQGISPALTPEVQSPADLQPAPGADKAPGDSGDGGQDSDAFDQYNSTVEEVLGEVKAGRLDATAALNAEKKGKKRTSLINELEKLI
jgi:hypothetical protein